ncbi:MAG: hypothetical protein JWN38_980 [Candidatus Saccharibacteria bacterium]|nr:hypothetical protein [Candidatus Saccharibacteria bacterium]
MSSRRFLQLAAIITAIILAIEWRMHALSLKNFWTVLLSIILFAFTIVRYIWVGEDIMQTVREEAQAAGISTAHMWARKVKQAIIYFIIPAALITALLVTVMLLVVHNRNAHQFARPDQLIPTSGKLELCSDYAGLCFTRPANWTRSTILHAGLAKQNDIEINPPSGSILRLEAIGSDTSNKCPYEYSCTVDTVNVTRFRDNIAMVAGIFASQPSDTNTITGFRPFIQLLSDQDVTRAGLNVGKSSTFTSFNYGVALGHGSKVLLQISPGKGFDEAAARQWLNGSEAATAEQILASVRAL